MTDVAGMSDQDLAWLLDAARQEYQRRSDLVSALGSTPGLVDALLTSTGREPGAEYVAPTGAHDAYPLGWVVTHEGVEYEATRDGAVGVPGDSVDWRRIAAENEVLPWVQPMAGQEYPVGAIVTHQGKTWRNDHVGPNGWEPGQPGSQWTEIEGE